MALHSLTHEDILYLEAKRKRDTDFRRHEANVYEANQQHRKLMENTDDDYFTPDSNNEAYYLSQYA